MSKIIPEFEVIFNDLLGLSFGDFLLSREFKLFLTSKNEKNRWKKTLQGLPERSYYIPEFDNDKDDAEDVFAMYLNATKENQDIENLVTEIIIKFISTKKEKTDFSHFLESLSYTKFTEENLQGIQNFVTIHEQSSFPIKEAKEYITKNPLSKANKIDIFIVHGHNEEIMHKVARTVEKLNLNPVILNEQADEGLTIIEKFEKHSDVGFAVVLLTFDDHGNAKNNTELNKRARQNVILELGYFSAKLGRKNIFTLYEDGVELPSDFSGVLYTKIDKSDDWKLKLTRELKSSGFEVDANKFL